jgi:hypothetical protein
MRNKTIKKNNRLLKSKGSDEYMTVIDEHKNLYIIKRTAFIERTRKGYYEQL